MLKFFAKAGLKRSEKELVGFIEPFIAGPDYDNSIFIWHAAILNYQMSLKDLVWAKCLGSQIGENQGPISTQIIQSNRLINGLHKRGDGEALVGMKIWNMTFRAMSNQALHHHGKKLWSHIQTLQSIARITAEDNIEEMITLAGTDSKTAQLMKNSIDLVDFVPTQFR